MCVEYTYVHISVNVNILYNKTRGTRDTRYGRIRIQHTYIHTQHTFTHFIYEYTMHKYTQTFINVNIILKIFYCGKFVRNLTEKCLGNSKTGLVVFGLFCQNAK